MPTTTDSRHFRLTNQGDNLRSVSRTERINALQNTSKSFLFGEPYSPGQNTGRIIGPGWVIHRSRMRKWWGGGGAQTADFPFRVIARINPNTHNLQIGVIHNSHVFMSDDRDSYDEPNDDWGLLDYDISQDIGWFDISGIADYGKKVWLQIELNEENEIESIDVNFEKVQTQSAWTPYPDPIEINIDDPQHPYQQFYHQIIAEITNPQNDPRDGDVYDVPGTNPPVQIQVTQLLYEDIMLVPAHTTGAANEPNVQLYVNSGTYVAGTDTSGTAGRIPDENDLMTPWQNGERENIWNFRLFNAWTTESGPGVVILDGMFNGIVPQQMADANDSFRLDITEWDPGDGEVDIVISCNYQMDGTFQASDLDIMAVKPENYPEDEPEHVVNIGIGVVYVDTASPNKIVEVRNTWLGDIDVELQHTEVYAFQMFDSSTAADGANVRIFDGSVIDQDGGDHLPNEMGNDDFEAGPLNDGDSIWLSITHDSEWNITAPPDWNWGATVDDDTDTVANIVVAYVEVYPPEGQNETVPQVIPHNVICGDIEFLPPEVFNRYAFEIIDKSTGESADVLILDGDVIDQDGEGHTPNDMGNDDFTADDLPAGTTYFWVTIEHDDNFNITANPDINWDQNGAPDDTDTESNIEFGYVDVENVDGNLQVTMIHNTICGDIFFDPPPPDDVNFNFKLEDASDGGTAQVRVYTGNVFGPNEGDTDVISGLDGDNNTIFPAYDGMEVYIGIQWDQETDNGISGDNITSMWIATGETPDDTYLTQYVTLGDMAVTTDGSGNAFVDAQNSVCGDISIPYPPYLDSDQEAYLHRDVNTGNVVWKKSGITIVGETGVGEDGPDIDNVDSIHFTAADDPSAGYIEVTDEGIDDNDMHDVTVKIPIIPVVPEGETENVLGNDGGATVWFSTTDCSDA